MSNVTRIDPEEYAYNTSNGSHWRSGRKARVIFPDGKVRTVTCGVADTFFSIPAHDSRGRVGFVSVDTDIDEYVFTYMKRAGSN